VRPGPPARNEVPLSVRVASPFAARGEVEERAGLRCRLAEMTGSAGRGSAVCGDATEFRDNPGRSRRVVKQQFPEVTLGFGCLELGIRAPIGKPWLRKLGIVRRDQHFLDATDLLVDEPAQLGGTVALCGGDSAAQQGKGDCQSRAEGTAAGRLLPPHRRGEM